MPSAVPIRLNRKLDQRYSGDLPRMVLAACSGPCSRSRDHAVGERPHQGQEGITSETSSALPTWAAMARTLSLSLRCSEGPPAGERSDLATSAPASEESRLGAATKTSKPACRRLQPRGEERFGCWQQRPPRRPAPGLYSEAGEPGSLVGDGPSNREGP